MEFIELLLLEFYVSPFDAIPLGEDENIRDAVYRGCIPFLSRSAPPLQILCICESNIL